MFSIYTKRILNVYLVYVDDTVLLAPSPKAIQSLINICVLFANNHGLEYNEQKTKFMCLKPAVLMNTYVPNVELVTEN